MSTIRFVERRGIRWPNGGFSRQRISWWNRRQNETPAVRSTAEVPLGPGIRNEGAAHWIIVALCISLGVLFLYMGGVSLSAYYNR